MKYRILDLDNCLSDDGWRIPKINWQKTGDARYQEYHLLCGFDRVVNTSLLDPRYENIILTGRPNLVRGITEEWLARAAIPFRFMLMRNNGSEITSLSLKRQMIFWLLEHYEVDLMSIVDAYDDHAEIVEMYKAFGIEARQRVAHSLSAYDDPRKKELTA